MADAITHWNDVLLKVIRQVGGAPGPITRGAAMMHASVYDAVNSIAPSPYRPYLVSVPAAPNASIEAAVAQAAYATLTAAFPTTTVPLGEILADEINALPPGPEVAAGESVGKDAAAAMLAARHGDGADDTAAYVSNPPAPGDWRPTGSGGAAGPYWGHVRPFCIPTGQSFRPPRPGGYAYKKDMLKSSEYAAAH